jgi:hypothetical protein
MGIDCPPLVVYHTQIIWSSWFVKQLTTGQTRVIAAPDFCHGLDAFDMHNNLSWLPSVSNVPALQALTSPSRNLGGGGGSRGGGGTSNQPARTAPTTTASAVSTTAAPAGNRRDPGRPVRNTDRDAMFTGNTPFVANVRTRHVSPLGVVPQRDQRPRTISDYSFFLVNKDTANLPPAESMQLGRALWRILNAIARANPNLGPVYLSKVYIADDFYRIWVRSGDVAKLGVLLPTRSGEEPLIGFPLALPMGWSQSPPIFTSATETIADLANESVKVCSPQLPHRLEAAAETTRRPAAAPTRRQNDELRHPLQ